MANDHQPVRLIAHTQAAQLVLRFILWAIGPTAICEPMRIGEQIRTRLEIASVLTRVNKPVSSLGQYCD
jgi:hypothetical protein